MSSPSDSAAQVAVSGDDRGEMEELIESVKTSGDITSHRMSGGTIASCGAEMAGNHGEQ